MLKLIKESIAKLSFKKLLGATLILIGFAALITPFTPGSWLIFVGLELIGIRLLIVEKFKERLKNYFKPPGERKPPATGPENKF